MEKIEPDQKFICESAGVKAPIKTTNMYIAIAKLGNNRNIHEK